MAETQLKWNATRVFILIMVAVFFLSTVAYAGFVIYEMVTGDSGPAAETTISQGETLENFTPGADIPELKVEDTSVGDGAVATNTSKVTVLYTGALASTGVIFDKTADGSPAQFSLNGGVIKGFSEGIAGMRVGGTRRIFIPSDMGYGASGSGSTIPANADLVFDVTLLNATQ